MISCILSQDAWEVFLRRIVCLVVFLIEPLASDSLYRQKKGLLALHTASECSVQYFKCDRNYLDIKEFGRYTITAGKRMVFPVIIIIEVRQYKLHKVSYTLGNRIAPTTSYAP